MDDRFINKIITKVKDKFTKKNNIENSTYEYAFSTEELKTITKENNQKIKDLKKEGFTQKKSSYNSLKTDEVLSKASLIKEEETINEFPLEDKKEEKNTSKYNTNINSFINLDKEYQTLIMTKWQSIKDSDINKDIEKGKELLSHSAVITYADETLEFIKYLRKKYELVILYLIGFNNEKQGIYNKTSFSSDLNEEWKYLDSYIKLLEKIKNFKS